MPISTNQPGTRSNLPAVLLAGLIASSAAAQLSVPVQWTSSANGNGHWYAFKKFSTGSSFATAQADAHAIGAHLATVTSSLENEWVKSNVVIPAADAQIWGPSLGARKIGSNWTWVTGEPWSFTAWGPAEPSGDGSSLQYWRYGALYWNDYPDGADVTTKWIYEWSADCNNDGVVDYGQIRSGQLIDTDADNVPDCCEQSLPCVPGNGAVQWRQDSSGNGHWYQKQGPFSTWFQARDAAIAVGAHLMTITSEAEWSFAFANIPSQAWGGTVLGGFQLPDSPEPGIWVWVTGEQPWPSFINVNLFDDCPGGFSGACASSCPTPNQQDHLLFTWPGGTNPNQGFDDAGADFSECGSTPSRWAIFEWDADCNSNGIIDYGEIRAGFTQDVNGNNIPDCCEPGNSCCPGDINASRTVDGADVGILLGYWGEMLPTTPPAVDINHDGVVNGADLGMLLSHWGACP